MPSILSSDTLSSDILYTQNTSKVSVYFWVFELEKAEMWTSRVAQFNMEAYRTQTAYVSHQKIKRPVRLWGEGEREWFDVFGECVGRAACSMYKHWIYTHVSVGYFSLLSLSISRSLSPLISLAFSSYLPNSLWDISLPLSATSKSLRLSLNAYRHDLCNSLAWAIEACQSEKQTLLEWLKVVSMRWELGWVFSSYVRLHPDLSIYIFSKSERLCPHFFYSWFHISLFSIPSMLFFHKLSSIFLSFFLAIFIYFLQNPQKDSASQFHIVDLCHVPALYRIRAKMHKTISKLAQAERSKTVHRMFW